ncbi:hypothetical protein LTR04_005320 [Oleoguttula sp. CCFEE 6159]|nr:hypothetical protein LTR04_005320 [Oleoguttula sp. CCFEE 6159]
MEPSPKRLRVDGSSQYNPGLDLQYDRQQNDLRLKGIFEHIFQKYAKDFTEIGDEIDLETGEIVVNNGHLSRMRHEQDIVGEGDARHFVRAFADGLTHEHGFGDSEEEDELSSDGPVIEEGQESSEDIVMIEDSEDEEDGGSVQLSLDTLHVLPVNPAGIARDVTAMDSAGESQTDIDNGLENSEPRHDNDPTQADIWNDFPAIGDALALSELSGPSRQSFNAGDVQALGLTIANQISEFLARSQHRAQPLESAWRTPQPRSTDFRRSLTRQDNKSIALRSPSPLGQRSLWAADPQPVARIRKRRLHSSLSGASTPRQLQSNPILDRLNSTHEDSTTNGNVVAEAHGFDLAPGVSVHGSLSDDDTLHTGYSANTKRRISSPQRAGSRRAPRTTFSRQEDELIIRLREENELDWRSIAKFLPDKPPQSIPLHYCRMLKPVGGPNARSVFSKQEDALIIKSREEDELDWRSIAELLPDKTPQSLLLHYSRKLKHRQKWQIEKSPLHSHTETVDGQEMSLPSMDTSRAVTTALDEQRESTQLSRLGDPRGFLSAMPLLADHFSEEDLVEQVQSKHKVDTDLPLSTNFGFPRPPRRLRHSASSINLRPTLETTHSTSVLKGQAALDALFAADAFLNESRNDASEDTAKSSHVVERTLLQNTKHTAYAVPKATDSTIAHDVSSKIRGDPSIEGRRSVHNLEESCGFSEKTTVYKSRTERMRRKQHSLLRKEQKEQELAEYSRRSGSPQVLIDSLVRVKEEVSPRIVSNRVGTREHVPAEVAPWWNAPESDTIEKKGLGESLPRKKVARKSTTGNNILSGSTPGSIRKAQKTPIEEDLLEDELAL